jgi:cell wall-associated NlpC family hydrolase
MDLNAIKSKLTQLQSTTSTKDNFWKPEPGTTLVRIVPYKHNKDNPFIELYFHYNLGNNKTYMSPASFGRPDPVEEFANKLKSTGNKDEWIQGKRLEPKMRTFVPVVVRGREDEGVKFWGFGKTVYQELLGVIADPDYGDITDPTTGRDVGIERQTPAEAGNQYGKTTVRVKPNQTPITENATLLESIFENQSDLTELYTEPTYDELKEALSNFLNPSDDTTETSAGVATSTTPTTNTGTATTTTTATKTDVSDAFDDLFNS